MTSVTIQETSFPSQGLRCAATLHLPAQPGPRPAVVLGFGLGGIRRMKAGPFAERFAEAGLAALTFDYRYWADSDGHPRQLLDLRRQRQDWQAALRFLGEHSRVDPTRVALWGSSLAAAHVQHLAAHDHTVAACIVPVPVADGLMVATAGGLAHVARCTVAGLRDLARTATGRSPYLIKIFGPRGSLAALASAEAESGYLNLLPARHEWDQLPWDNAIPARVVLTIPTYRPGRRAHQIRCPILYQIAEHDTVTPPHQALRAAHRAPHAEIRQYPIGHFDIYHPPAFNRAVADQITFLTTHLAV